jgi:uncharacterized OB-fold protein
MVGDGVTDPGQEAGSAPQPDLESAAWWEGLRAHRVTLQHCQNCDRTRFPPMPTCPWCASAAFDVVESTGQGIVYSFVTAHVAVSPGYRGPLPYSVATVELTEGPRLLGRVEPSAPLAVGDRVVARFADHVTWTELYFEPEAAQLPEPEAAHP